jgi:hypothetical protein
MRRARLLGAAVAASASLAVGVVSAATGSGIHVFPVSLTISADRPAGELKGEVNTDAPSEFCDSSTLRIVRQMPGNDEVVARVRPYIGKWHIESPPRIRGDRVYAEVLRYHLPERPVICLAARSRTVTAP